ncbi:metabotropic glutamate receptor 3-like [Stegodyphus dumicola]|uniref:metabotropic glutamate receptor 3-like n=1 Tax=Stegodyphus dumicola TaxID=202533 RepID=UPI0015AC2725|nr:metabotropic glutamate receptor 3-like [Stegodyphus dumicola]
MNAMRFKHDDTAFPRSFCSAPCQRGQAKLQLEGDTCCWLCTNCSTFQYLPDEYHCRDCPFGTLPSATKTTCEPIPEAYLSYSSPWAIGTMAFAGLGIMTTTVVAIVFWAYGDTPIIKASGRELSGLLLLGIFLSFGMTFVIVAKPAPCTCGITRFFLGFCYTLCYAAIVTKTNRIARIFNQKRKKPCQKPRYTSPKSQLIITALLVSVEGIINTTWLLYDRPAVTHMYPTREENVLICLGSDTASYLVGLIYPFILIGFCTVYAFKTRKCPDGFNEARYLTFTNYTTCVIWLAFLPLFVLSTSNTIRAVTLSSLLSLSGAVQLACLFMPKVYIALFKPEKNTKESVMCHHNRNSSCLTLPAAAMYQGMPSILLNGGCKDNYRNSTCSSASPSSIRNSNIQAPSPVSKHNSDHNLCYSQQPESRQRHIKNTCSITQQNMNLALTPTAPSCGHQNYTGVDQHMTL